MSAETNHTKSLKYFVEQSINDRLKKTVSISSKSIHRYRDSKYRSDNTFQNKKKTFHLAPDLEKFGKFLKQYFLLQ
jgi:hypothetical protein